MSAQDTPAAELLIAVDAGGTKTAACFALRDGANRIEILGRGRTMGANPLTIGVEQSAEVVAAAVDLARNDAGLPATVASRAVLSIAGAADPLVAQQLVEQLRTRNLAARIAIVSDVLPILAACSEQGVGIALIAGTGSVAVGKDATGRSIRCGGWGYLLGDDGSGYAIGRAAIRVALADLESVRSEPRPLSMAVLDLLNSADRAELIKAVHTGTNSRSTIASVAERVGKLAGGGDASAKQILDAAGHDLAQLVARTAREIVLDSSEVPIAMAGGVLVASEYLRDAVVRNLAALNLDCRVRVVADPLEGCLRLAVSEAHADQIAWH